ncbi:MAG TPA: 4a-hydroxytetrahydrobiopterin dehydratase [Candidatus Competibacteraceae bacterium]|nr:4a-hydroxytetrahydrobiopterin dehydratase [Candidatus Competibacteraceae bacterium]
MNKPLKLSDEQIIIRLQEIKKNWSYVQGKLYAEFKFKDFVEAFGFMSKVAILAESLHHHPEWSNVYNRVKIFLVTHDAGGVSAKDFELAKRIDQLL